MRSRISVGTRRKLERLEQSFAVGRPIALWPTMLSCDEWEHLAMASQEILHVETNDSNNPTFNQYKT